MRVAIGGFGAESNAFSVESPVTKVKDFLSGKQLISENFGKRNVIGGFLDVLTEDKIEVVPVLRVWCGATGIIAEDVYEQFKSMMVTRIREAGSLDGLLFDLHGAMVAEDTLDAEGFLLKELRDELGGEIPIIAVLDIHGNITDLKVEGLMPFYREKLGKLPMWVEQQF